MPKYSIVVSADERFIAGINGMLNSLRYYEMEDIEYHLIHTFPTGNSYIQQASDIFPYFKPIRLDDFMIQSGRWKTSEKVGRSAMKFARWWYSADRLKGYDAICVLDADRQIVNNLRPFFDIIAKSDMIGLAKNDWSEAEWDSYDEKRAMEGQPPLYCNPFFITGKRASEFFPLIPEYARNPRKYYPEYRREETGDMHPVNLILLQSGMIKDLFPLPATQWVFVNHTHVRLQERYINNKRYIGLHKTGDCLYTYHRKYWSQNECSKLMRQRDPELQKIARNNVRLLWENTRFFNMELYLKIDWKWGDFPE